MLNSRAMASVFLWLEALAGLHALYDVVRTGTDYATSFSRHRSESRTNTEARVASAKFSTYSDREVEELIRKIEGCRDRFINQGGGKDRARCLCSIFNEVKDGNGGTLPDIDSWRDMYKQLDCAG
jgi:hypothetical protein